MQILKFLWNDFVKTMKCNRGDFGGADEGAQERATEVEARTAAATAITEEERGREARVFDLEENVQQELTRRFDLTGEELLRELGPIATSFLDTVARDQGKTGEQLFRELGAVPSALQEQVLKRVQAPGATFQNTLEQQLELARQRINAEANRRGVFGGTPEGGIRFEQLGRAGVDLAIKSARERQTAEQLDLSRGTELSNIFAGLRSTALERGGLVTGAASGERGRATVDLRGFLQDIQNLAAQSRQRAGQGVISGSQIGSTLNIAGIEQAGATRRQREEQFSEGLGALAGSFSTPTP